MTFWHHTTCPTFQSYYRERWFGLGRKHQETSRAPTSTEADPMPIPYWLALGGSFTLYFSVCNSQTGKHISPYSGMCSGYWKSQDYKLYLLRGLGWTNFYITLLYKSTDLKMASSWTVYKVLGVLYIPCSLMGSSTADHWHITSCTFRYYNALASK